MSYINVVGVQFNTAGKIYDFSINDLSLRVGDPVVVDTERGASLAKVVTVKFISDSFYEKGSLKKVLRKASKKDLDSASKLNEDDVLVYTRKKVKELDLEMKVLKGEIQFSGNKVILYFTAPGRIDFRDLVKELATGLMTRVELKQVGARDEAKLIGGLGICGREFCCSSFLREFVPVSIKMAKNQNLALNPTKISGGCGRLLCCLTYENDTYTELKKHMPAIGKQVEVIEDGQIGKVVRSDFLNQLVTVRFDEHDEEEFSANEVRVITRSPRAPSENKSESSEEWGEDIDLAELQQEDKAQTEKNKRSDHKKPRHQDRDEKRPTEGGQKNRRHSNKPRRGAKKR